MSFRIEDILKDKPKCVKNVQNDAIEAPNRFLQDYYYSHRNFADFNGLFGNGQASTTCYSFNNHLLDNGHPMVSGYAPQSIWPLYARNFHQSMPHFSYQHCNKRKGGQVRFTTLQTDALEKRFKSHKYLSPEDRKHLADALKLSDRQVKTWFQNRRAKWRRCNNISCGSERIQTDSDVEEEIDKQLNTNY